MHEISWQAVSDKLSTLNRSHEYNIERLHDNIFQIHDFLSINECAQLRLLHEQIVEEKKKTQRRERWCVPEAVIKNLLKKKKINKSDLESRSLTCVHAKAYSAQKILQTEMYKNISVSCVIPSGRNDVVDEIEKNIQEKIGLFMSNGFHTQTVRYDRGSEYNLHADCWLREQDAPANDRAVTVLAYLTPHVENSEEGGETVFPLLGIRVRPRLGSVLIWTNMDAAGKCLSQMQHLSAIVKGEAPKLILQKWYHRAPLCPGLIEEQTICDSDSVSCRSYASAVQDKTEIFNSALAALWRGNVKTALSGLEGIRSTFPAAATLRGEILTSLAQDGLASYKDARSALTEAVQLCSADEESKTRLLSLPSNEVEVCFEQPSRWEQSFFF